MTNGRVYIALGVMLLCLGAASGVGRGSQGEELVSQLTAQNFHKLAYELYMGDDAIKRSLDEATAFLSGVFTLDPRAEYVYADILRIMPKIGRGDQRQLFWAFKEYVDGGSDLEVASNAVRHLLNSQDSRQAREQALGQLLQAVGDKNAALSSELATQMALLLAEKADTDGAMNYLMHAFDSNPYNRLAFSKLVELKRDSGEDIPPLLFVQDLRLAIEANPMNIDAGLAFANYVAKLGLYEMASDSYEYCSQLWRYLYSERPLPASLYLPWIISNYNTRRGSIKCLEIAASVRRQGSFDLILEGVAAKASEKVSGQTKREAIAAGQRAEDMLSSGYVPGNVPAEQVAWFYSLALPMKDKALAWANRAYSRNSDLPSVNAILAYALVMNGQHDLARDLVTELRNNNQIAALTLGIILLEEGNKSIGIAALKQAVGMDSGSLAADVGRRLLGENGSEYIADFSPDLLMQALRGEFDQRLVPRFNEMDRLMSAKLGLAGSDFSYGGDFEGMLVIKNKSKGPLIISDTSLFKGNIQVDAEVKGDIKAYFPGLIRQRVRLSEPVRPGYFASIPLDLMTGPLLKILRSYPQASLEIEFTVYLDPIADDIGVVKSSLPNFGPLKAVARRKGEVVTQRNLIQRLDILSTGKNGQKVRMSTFFAGLLMEYYAMNGSDPLYRHVSIEPSLLKSAIRKGLEDGSWEVRAHTMWEMVQFPVPLEYDLTKAVSENLNHKQWPVRMMALYLLNKSYGDSFKRVLDRTVMYDKHQMVRNMAVSLGATVPEVADDVAAEEGL
ncbi:MAG TPA: hypothetical protein ENH94_11595 [Phycisphaerales bacterium]|nr:hypothetical protein [Phycisphaerales bacterium]